MEHLSAEYKLLFNGITSAIEDLNALLFRLAALQYQAEELFISRPDSDSESGS